MARRTQLLGGRRSERRVAAPKRSTVVRRGRFHASIMSSKAGQRDDAAALRRELGARAVRPARGALAAAGGRLPRTAELFERLVNAVSRALNLPPRPMAAVPVTAAAAEHAPVQPLALVREVLAPAVAAARGAAARGAAGGEIDLPSANGDLARIYKDLTSLYNNVMRRVDAAEGRVKVVGRTPPLVATVGDARARPALLLAHFGLDGDTGFVTADRSELHAATLQLLLRAICDGRAMRGRLLANALPVIAVAADDPYATAVAPTTDEALSALRPLEQLVTDALDNGSVASFNVMGEEPRALFMRALGASGVRRVDITPHVLDALEAVAAERFGLSERVVRLLFETEQKFLACCNTGGGGDASASLLTVAALDAHAQHLACKSKCRAARRGAPRGQQQNAWQ